MFGAFQVAIKPLRYIAINPAEGIKIPKNTKAKKEGKKYNYLESDNIKPFLTTAWKDNQLFYMFFKTAIYTGLRKGELAGLGWQDIDFEDGSIDVNKTLHHQLNEVQKDRIGEPKTEKAYRKIKVDKKRLEELKYLKKIADQNKEIYGDEYHYYE
ncbi:MAG: site-specific integrase, partial [Bacillus sp. (in: firmicutes)]